MKRNLERSNDIESIKAELEQERKYRDTMVTSNKELETSIHRMQKELQRVRKEDPTEGINAFTQASCEGYKQLQAQLAINSKLDKDIALEKERLRILTDSETDITELNLDGLTQAELIRVVKQLERMRTDLQSTLRDTEHNLDSQARDFFRLNETKRLYQTELDLRERSKGAKKFERFHKGSQDIVTST